MQENLTNKRLLKELVIFRLVLLELLDFLLKLEVSLSCAAATSGTHTLPHITYTYSWKATLPYTYLMHLMHTYLTQLNVGDAIFI
jgi:hypothetical protein